MRSHGSVVWPILAAALVVLAGCSRDRTFEKPPIHIVADMDFQPKAVAQAPNDFFGDGMAMRPKLPGTVAREDLVEDQWLATGRDATGTYRSAQPLAVDDEVLARGQQVYGIYCAPCHGDRGDGEGMMPRRSGVPVPSFFEPRLLEAADGQIVAVINEGLGLMASYRSQVAPADRWAVVAWIRRLQEEAGPLVSGDESEATSDALPLPPEEESEEAAPEGTSPDAPDPEPDAASTASRTSFEDASDISSFTVRRAPTGGREGPPLDHLEEAAR